jgi:TadE-like protein
MSRSTAAKRSQRGQASVEFVAILPPLVVAVLIAAQIGVAGWALWSAGIAARAGARAAHVGREASGVAERTLPRPLREGAKVREEHGVLVRVRVPTLIPGLPRIHVRGRAGLGVGDGSS